MNAFARSTFILEDLFEKFLNGILWIFWLLKTFLLLYRWNPVWSTTQSARGGSVLRSIRGGQGPGRKDWMWRKGQSVGGNAYLLPNFLFENGLLVFFSNWAFGLTYIMTVLFAENWQTRKLCGAYHNYRSKAWCPHCPEGDLCTHSVCCQILSK